jgi:hypothetical protein
MEQCTTEELGSPDPDALRLLWSILRILVMHHGKISSAPYEEKGSVEGVNTPERMLAEALLGVDHPAALQAVGGGRPADWSCVDRIQAHLLHGRRSEALR